MCNVDIDMNYELRWLPAFDKAWLLLYFMHIRAEAEMHRKETAIQRTARNTGLDITLQDIVDVVEDELLVIDREYRVRFANLATRSRFLKEAESPIGRLCYEILHDRDRPCTAPLWDCPLRKVLESGSMTTIVHPARIHGTDTYLKITVSIRD